MNTTTFEITAKKDAWQNFNIDLSDTPEANNEQHRAFVLKKIHEISEQANSHVVIKISEDDSNLYTWIKEVPGFSIQKADLGQIILKKCFHANECLYPKSKTMEHGVMIIVFKNAKRKKFLTVKESTGQFRGLKPPTGSVDYYKEFENETVVRELEEETGMKMSNKQFRIAGLVSTGALAFRSPDRCFIFTADCENGKTQKFIPKAGEIAEVTWTKVDDFLKEEEDASNPTPSVFQRAVQIAKKSMENGLGLQPTEAYWGSFYWGSTKLVTVYGPIDESV